MGLLLFFMGLALGVSFLCSIMEATLLSVTPSYVHALVADGHPAGERLQGFKEDIDRPLAAILSLNTIANTTGAVGVGAQAEAVFGSSWVGVVSGVLTLLILVCSEIIPKTLGAAYWRKLAPPLSRLLAGMVVVLWPFVWLAQRVTNVMSPDAGGDTMSREELGAMAALGAEQGLLDEGESKILQNLLRLGRLTAEDIMTPRTVLHALPETATTGEVADELDTCPVSRVILYDETLDRVTGYALRDDMLLRAARGDVDTKLSDIRRDIVPVPTSLPLPQLFDELLRSGHIISLVVDEYGGTAGIATLEDVVETLLGTEIVDEADDVADMQALARRRAQAKLEG